MAILHSARAQLTWSAHLETDFSRSCTCECGSERAPHLCGPSVIVCPSAATLCAITLPSGGLCSRTLDGPRSLQRFVRPGPDAAKAPLAVRASMTEKLMLSSPFGTSKVIRSPFEGIVVNIRRFGGTRLTPPARESMVGDRSRIAVRVRHTCAVGNYAPAVHLQLCTCRVHPVLDSHLGVTVSR